MRRTLAAVLLLTEFLPCAVRAERYTLTAIPSLDQRLQQLGNSTIPPLAGDLVSLDYPTVIQMSLQRNLSILNDSYAVRIAKVRIDQAIAARNPSFTAIGYYSHQDPHLTRAIRPDVSFIREAEAAGIDAVSQYTTGQNQMLNRSILYVPIYTGGLLESAIHVQKALARATSEGVERTRELVSYETKQQYFAAMLAHENLELAEQTVLQADEIQKIAQSKLRAGVGTRYDTLQAHVAKLQAEDAVVKTRASWRATKSDLAAVLNLPILTKFAIKESLSNDDVSDLETVPKATLQQRVESALGRRPELAALRANLVANRERLVGASSGTLPKLTQQFQYDLIGYTATLRGGYLAISSLTIPIYDGGVARTHIKQFKLRGLQLKNQEIRQVVAIALDVLRAQLGLQDSVSRLQQARVSADRAREALRIAKLRFDVGAGTSLELVTSETTLANSRFDLARARYRLLLSRASINLAGAKRD
jgi:outer membrane protein TolC